jgi:hypothetical protein
MVPIWNPYLREMEGENSMIEKKNGKKIEKDKPMDIHVRLMASAWM